MKNIVFCADGTWQSPLNNTNVYRLYKGLMTSAGQIPFYDDGVGAEGDLIQRLVQGATGDGLVQKVMDGYTKIAHMFTPGDKVYLFGFSRGAFTARSIAGMITACGLPAANFDLTLVPAVFNAYRDPINRAKLLAPHKDQLSSTGIEFIGVWDTVGSLGIPALFGGFDTNNFGFLDTKLHPDVKHAVHCVSIDEHRRQFPATLWDRAIAEGQTLDQVYFVGCHGDIGGGTLLGGGVDDSTRLCDLPLGYMVGKAQASGLTFDEGFLASCNELPTRYAFDKYRDSWKPEFQVPLLRPIDDDAQVANSVQIRMKYMPEYSPSNLTIDEGQLATTYKLEEVIEAA